MSLWPTLYMHIVRALEATLYRYHHDTMNVLCSALVRVSRFISCLILVDLIIYIRWLSL